MGAKSSRERTRLYRERKRAGRRVVVLEFDAVELAFVLESLHFLNPTEEDNDAAVQRALGNMIRIFSRELARDA
ncbi:MULTISPECIES: hypothetical protein [Rhizobium]|uniref:hypothetical protein n=1 Tax=Rhizobium TaxID=379 RepID=UPI00103027B0|nr:MULTISPECIES: hypothetical protein [Rhizobium]MBY5483251.1 hypothetical protein [Rhizobium leguminosarum]NEI28471.1 hypothetical protein [Rhizobium ruizarguesonis]NKL64994.1 hypothetical protein [Rhizobium leguminosarum bv. viciae]TBA81188.1 hypothetical protein ELH56_13540 [Rhizobium ruizarguesonis]TBZ64514.1 hypothetical protein E0H43_32850 [Rhizobium leguminosarum bv. viciae]